MSTGIGRRILLPVVLSAGLLLLGSSAVSADTSSQPREFTVAGETVVVTGTGQYELAEDALGLHVSVESGEAQIQIGTDEVLLGPGDAITMAADSFLGTVSLTFSVSAGAPTLMHTDPLVIANANDTPLTLMPGTTVSFGTQVPTDL